MKKHLIKVHRNLSNDDYKKIWKEAIFIFDSNVLLDLYRLPESAKNDLVAVLKNKDFNSRIWIGFQVLIEFLNNRLTIIGEQKNMFSKVVNMTTNHVEKIKELNNEYIQEINKLNLNQRHSTISPDGFLSEKKIKKSIKVFDRFVSHLNEKEKNHNDVNDKDEIKELILNIFNDKIGGNFNNDDLIKIEEEGKQRYLAEIPPGYKDHKKEGFHFVHNQKYQRKYGDLFLWKEIINHTNNNKFKYIVLVTGDVKEDWWEEKRGRKIGPRKELLNEIYTCCEDLDVFHMYNTSTFLQYAKLEIDSEIKDSSIEDARKLININNKSENRRMEVLKTQEQLSYANKKIEELNRELEYTEVELRNTKNYRSKLYNNGTADDVRDYAHNLAYVQSDLEENISLLMKKISSLHHYKSDKESKLNFYLKEIQSGE